MLKDAPIARLALADGSLFRGVGFGAVETRGCVCAEVVFNTAMTGYQESLTDPSYAGQILVQTTPLIGNTGVNGQDMESGGVRVSGLVVHELARLHSNWRADGTLDGFLRDAGVIGLAGVDTRALTRLLRSHGTAGGALTVDASISDEGLVARARETRSMEGQNLAAGAGCSSACSWDEGLGDWAGAGARTPRRTSEQSPVVLALDCGVKRNILRHLAARGCRVRVEPHDTAGEQIVASWELGDIDGLFISNGPGDPGAVGRTIGSLKHVLSAPSAREMPVFGVCLGHQLLALALGATTYKLPFGHRGANQPVCVDDDGRVQITSQNHGFAVDRASLEACGGRVTHTHLNDQTVAGFEVVGRAVFGVQFHPEASPGPHDAGGLFDRFVGAMRARSGHERGRGAGEGASYRSL